MRESWGASPVPINRDERVGVEGFVNSKSSYELNLAVLTGMGGITNQLTTGACNRGGASPECWPSLFSGLFCSFVHFIFQQAAFDFPIEEYHAS